MIEQKQLEEAKSFARKAWEMSRGHHNILFFSGGFIFDAVTLDRIDAWLDLGLQALYLSLTAALLWFQARYERGEWKPTGTLERIWPYERDLLHFLFGGLLSAYVIFYSRSGVGARSFLFFAVIGAILFSNELSEERDWGHPVRTGVFAFCLASFSIYFVPVMVGGIGDGVFAIAMSGSALVFTLLVLVLTRPGVPELHWKRALASGWLGILALIFVSTLYMLRWIPPVPLALQYAGIYHGVERIEGNYSLKYERRSRWDVFRREDKPYYFRKGDRLYCFVRIFAPAKFSHDILLNWQTKDAEGNWVSRDRIPLPIKGGRDAGYRGFAYKERFGPGDWRIDIETQDGRIVGRNEVRVISDERTDARDWRTASM